MSQSKSSDIPYLFFCLDIAYTATPFRAECKNVEKLDSLFIDIKENNVQMITVMNTCHQAKAHYWEIFFSKYVGT